MLFCALCLHHSSTITVPPSTPVLWGKDQVLFVSLLSVCIGFKIHYILCAFSCNGIKTTPLLSFSPQSSWYTMSVKSFFHRVLGLCAWACSFTQALNSAFSCWPSVNFPFPFSAGLCPSVFHSTLPFPELRQTFSYSSAIVFGLLKRYYTWGDQLLTESQAILPPSSITPGTLKFND